MFVCFLVFSVLSAVVSVTCTIGVGSMSVKFASCAVIV